VRGGQVLGHRDAADGALTVGDEVTAVDEDEDMRFQGTVLAIEGDKVYLEVHWKPTAGAASRFYAQGNRIHRDKKKPAGLLIT